MSADKLGEYRAKRNFGATDEPHGADVAPSTEPAGGDGRARFVVQRHRARRRHYDLRLEVNGVLASWAVPKGPTLDPDTRQLAVHVEDHPLEYFDFEGVIAKGEYGAGDVIVWDWGHWTTDADDPAAAIAEGELHFDLYGEKLSGRFALVQTRRADGRQWLLVHKHDEHARPGWDPEDAPRSVKTGRTNDEVASAPAARWHGDRPADQAEESLRPSPGSAADVERPRGWEPVTADELAALDELGEQGRWAVAGEYVALTNLDKVLFPGRDGADPVTKRDLVRYYATVAGHLLPYLHDRPINLHRFPDGVERDGFWQKEVPDHAPDWLTRWHYTGASTGRTECYAVLDSVPSLVWMANHAAVELHPWTSRLTAPEEPTWALIDIDPGERTTFAQVLELTRLYRTALDHLELAAAAKVTGQRGIQVWVPVAAGYGFADTRAWVEKLSRAVGRTLPKLVSWQWHRDRRGGLARLDYTQNALNKTLVAPFSPRPAGGAPVSMPIEWAELDDPELRPDRWTVHTALDRLAAAGDPLAPLIGRQQRLPPL